MTGARSALGLVANGGALACIAVAFFKRNDVVVEGAYFNRSVGDGSGDSFAVTSANLTPWLVGAAVLLIVGTILLATRDRPHP